MRKRITSLALFVLVGAFLVGCSTSPQQHYARGQKLERAGKLTAALHAYEKALPHIAAQDRHLQSDVLFRMGECLFRLDRVSDAYNAFQRAADVDNSNLMAQLRLGELFLANGALDKATEQARLVLAAAKDNTEGWALLGAAAAASDDLAVAQDAFTRVLEAEPTRLSVALALADIYNRADRAGDARAVLKRAIAAVPANSMPLLALGRLEEQEGNSDAAEEAYRKAVAAENTPETNLRLAQFLERAARIPEAELVLRRVDAQRPSLPTALPDFEVISGRAPNALDRYLAALQTSAPDKKSSAKRPLNTTITDPAQERAALAARLIEADLQAATDPSRAENQAATTRARAHLDEYRKDMDPATIGILSAELALAESDLPLAAIYAAGAANLAPQSAAAHYVLGVAKYRTGDSGMARSEWAAALDADSHFIPARLALTADALANSDPAGAESYVVPAVQDEPANLRALNLFARALVAQRRYAPAVVIAHRALAVDSSAAEPHLVLGEIALQQRSLGEALIQFEQAVLLEPHSRDAMEGLTRVYRQGSFSRAMLLGMEKVAAADPPSATLMEITGRLFDDHGWYQDAERCLAKALKLDPQRSTAARALAQTFVAKGQYVAAADSAAQAGGDSAALVEAFRAEQRNDTTTAIRSYERAVRAGERSGTAANNLAWIYAQQGSNLERALALAETAQTMNPASPAVLDTLGVVHLRRREYSQAIKALETANRLAKAQPDVANRQPLRAEIKQHLSEAYLRSGQPDAAAALVAEKQ